MPNMRELLGFKKSKNIEENFIRKYKQEKRKEKTENRRVNNKDSRPMINRLFNLILENASTNEKIEKNMELIKALREMNLSIEEIKELIEYLNLQKQTEKSFKKMNQYKKHAKDFEQEEYDKLKDKWNVNKNNLVRFQPDEELLKLRPDEITEDTEGNNVGKIIRKLNLGALSNNEREGLLDILIDNLNKLEDIESEERIAA